MFELSNGLWRILMSNLFRSWFKALIEKEPPEPANPLGTIIIGTLHPDIIGTAKEMVRKSLKAAQFKTINVGEGASVETFVSKMKETNADIIVITLNLSAAKKNFLTLLSALDAEGLKSKVTVIIGGAAVTQEDANITGVLYGKTRDDAVFLAKKAMNKKVLNP